MCPSYRATMEEKHSTRGRAHLLFEMMHGDVIRDGWKSKEVFDALDLCLSCKGCKGDCPVNVDMATYKAEFLSHYYENRLRPRYAYAMGWIHRWARLASHAPRVANAMANLPGPSVSRASRRNARCLSLQPRPSSSGSENGGRVTKGCPRSFSGPILSITTFIRKWQPRRRKYWKTQDSASIVPRAPLCCGRPLYDYGFLDQANELLGDILDHLRPSIEAGTPVVGLEPSCLAVFRDEMLDLRPHDQDAKRLHGQVFTLAEFLSRQDYKPPVLNRDIVVHGHCHQKAIISLDAEKKLFEAMGAKAEILDDGCCGMAGSFGFEQHKYDLSMQIYEHKLGPHLREMPSRKAGRRRRIQLQDPDRTGHRAASAAPCAAPANRQDTAMRRVDHRSDGLEDEGATDNSKLIRNGALLLGGVSYRARELVSRRGGFFDEKQETEQRNRIDF